MSNVPDGVTQFFRRVGQYLRRGSEVAGSWIDEQAAINQRVRAIRKLRSQQHSALTTIGAKVYALHRRGKVRNKDVLAECERIDEILAHIARLKKEIEEIRQRSSRPEVQLMEVKDDEPLEEAEEQEEAAEEVKPEGESAEAEGDEAKTAAAQEQDETAEAAEQAEEPELGPEVGDDGAQEQAPEAGEEQTSEGEIYEGPESEGNEDEPDLELWGEGEE